MTLPNQKPPEWLGELTRDDVRRPPRETETKRETTRRAAPSVAICQVPDLAAGVDITIPLMVARPSMIPVAVDLLWRGATHAGVGASPNDVVIQLYNQTRAANLATVTLTANPGPGPTAMSLLKAGWPRGEDELVVIVTQNGTADLGAFTLAFHFW